LHHHDLHSTRSIEDESRKFKVCDIWMAQWLDCAITARPAWIAVQPDWNSGLPLWHPAICAGDQGGCLDGFNQDLLLVLYSQASCKPGCFRPYRSPSDL